MQRRTERKGKRGRGVASLIGRKKEEEENKDEMHVFSKKEGMKEGRRGEKTQDQKDRSRKGGRKESRRLDTMGRRTLLNTGK